MAKEVTIKIGVDEHKVSLEEVQLLNKMLRQGTLAKMARPPKPIKRPKTLSPAYFKGVEGQIKSLSKDVDKLVASYDKLDDCYEQELNTADDKWVSAEMDRLHDLFETFNDKICSKFP